jgi:hypothetical protein
MELLELPVSKAGLQLTPGVTKVRPAITTEAPAVSVVSSFHTALKHTSLQFKTNSF